MVQVTECIFDDFERGGRLVWEPKTPSRWSIDPDSGDHAYHLNTTDFEKGPDNTPGEYSILNYLIDFPAYEIEVTARSPEPWENPYGHYGVIFGFLDSANYHYFEFYRMVTGNNLQRIRNNERRTIQWTFKGLVTDDIYQTMKLRIENDTVTVFADNQEKARIPAKIPRPSRVGFCTRESEAWFDDFSIKPLTRF
jgi:hypothetical protein